MCQVTAVSLSASAPSTSVSCDKSGQIVVWDFHNLQTRSVQPIKTAATCLRCCNTQGAGIFPKMESSVCLQTCKGVEEISMNRRYVNRRFCACIHPFIGFCACVHPFIGLSSSTRYKRVGLRCGIPILDSLLSKRRILDQERRVGLSLSASTTVSSSSSLWTP